MNSLTSFASTQTRTSHHGKLTQLVALLASGLVGCDKPIPEQLSSSEAEAPKVTAVVSRSEALLAQQYQQLQISLDSFGPTSDIIESTLLSNQQGITFQRLVTNPQEALMAVALFQIITQIFPGDEVLRVLEKYKAHIPFFQSGMDRDQTIRAYYQYLKANYATTRVGVGVDITTYMADISHRAYVLPDGTPVKHIYIKRSIGGDPSNGVITSGGDVFLSTTNIAGIASMSEELGLIPADEYTRGILVNEIGNLEFFRLCQAQGKPVPAQLGEMYSQMETLRSYSRGQYRLIENINFLFGHYYKVAGVANGQVAEYELMATTLEAVFEECRTQIEGIDPQLSEIIFNPNASEQERAHMLLIIKQKPEESDRLGDAMQGWLEATLHSYFQNAGLGS